MKTIIEINTVNYASTGNIVLNIAKKARESGFNVYTCCKSSKESFKYKYENQLFIGNRYERILSSVLCTVTGLRDHFNIFGTYSFIKKIDKLNPDLIHLHVLHDDFINISILFNYLKNKNIPVIWTFHDCNALTGKCPSFEMIGCYKWQNGCHNCPQLNKHPKALIDRTRYVWNKKRKLFNSLSELTITTPSNWLFQTVKKSYFSNYPINIISNGIDLNTFKPTENNIKEKYDIKDKYLVLGVANYWGKEKGLDVFIELSKILPDKYRIMLVGTNDQIDKLLPESIISIHRTYDQKDLVRIYTAADVFFNPTREDIFGLVNVEAQACGTPVLVFNTGGCPETVSEESGIVLTDRSINNIKSVIIKTCENKLFSKSACIKQAQRFDKDRIFNEYINLYKAKLDYR